MAKPFLLFIFSICLIASCTCSDKKVPVTTEGTSNATTTTDPAANLKEMGATANTNAVNKTQGEPGEEEMNRMYSTGNAAHEEMTRRNLLRRSGKLTNGYYPEGSERRLTEQDIQYLTLWGHTVMLNEIYARHGMTFKDENIQKHFTLQSWYHAQSADVYQKLSTVEKQNITYLINNMPKEDVAAN